MQNIRLNPGGVIGAILLVTAVIVVSLLMASPDKVGSRVGGFGVVALFVGAFGGNYLWDRWFPKNK